MNRLLTLAVASFLGFAGAAWGTGPCRQCEGHCIQPPPPPCPDCGCPCAKGLHLCMPWRSAHAHKLIDLLCHGDCCDRIKAADKLGCKLHADWCCDGEVLTALVGALACDPCWRVRRAAAWSLMLQTARTEQAVLALHLASKLDPHYLVRARAAEALDVLLLCRRECFKELLAQGDELVKQLRGKYKPGSPECAAVLAQCCEGVLAVTRTASPVPPVKPE